MGPASPGPLATLMLISPGPHAILTLTSRGPHVVLAWQGGKKSPEALARIMGAVKSNIIFSRLNELQLTMLQQAMMEHSVEAGENVITQGEKGNHFFIVDSGELDVFVTSDNPGDEPARVKGFGAGGPRR